MSNGLTHDEAREALDAVALDALDASERMAILAHVHECAECRDELASLERTAAELSYAAAPIAMSPAQRDRVRARLLARAVADRGDASGIVSIGSARSARTATPARSTGARWMAMAARMSPISRPMTLMPVVPSNLEK